MTNLLSKAELEKSPVVANCSMNRERRLCGTNGYEVEIGFDPLDWLTSRLRIQRVVRWLDLCCGSGRALQDAAEKFSNASLSGEVRITGVDLVGMFAVQPTEELQLIECSVLDYQPAEPFDLITCVHGMHYVGDKLRMLELVGSWLAPNGRFAANLGIRNICIAQSGRGHRTITRSLRDAGFLYDARKNLIERHGPLRWKCPFTYIGADDAAGPNYTKQPVVDSLYQRG